MNIEQHEKPLVRLGVDRPSLMAAGVNTSDVDRVFRSLFVYSMGFHQTINNIV